jgi:hypothetical protein
MEAELPKQLRQTKGQLLELLQLLSESKPVWSYTKRYLGRYDDKRVAEFHANLWLHVP